MITADEVIALIRKEMRGKLPADAAIDENTELTVLGLSSLQIAEIVYTLEEEYDVEFDPAKAADARTLGDLVALGNHALNAGATATNTAVNAAANTAVNSVANTPINTTAATPADTTVDRAAHSVADVAVNPINS